jgi:hypothetical protein
MTREMIGGQACSFCLWRELSSEQSLCYHSARTVSGGSLSCLHFERSETKRRGDVEWIGHLNLAQWIFPFPFVQYLYRLGLHR